MIAAWNRFFHEPADPRIPALIRIGYASLVLINLVAWFPYLEMWFGETGVLPSPRPATTPPIRLAMARRS